MKRKLETSEEINEGDVDEFRDQILEQELSNKRKNDDLGTTDESMVRVIKLRGTVPKLALPEDWVALYHKSGGIVYLNRKTRVCTWSRPYHIGQASVRKHDIPTVAIPCLHEMLVLKTQKMQRPGDVHGGNIGHHAGNLDNHYRDHGDHNKMKEEISTKISDEQVIGTDSAFGYHGNNDGSHGNPDGHHGNNGSHSNSSQGDQDGNYSNTDSNHVIRDDTLDSRNDTIEMVRDGHNVSDGHVARDKTALSGKAVEIAHSNSDSADKPSSKSTDELQMANSQEITNYLSKLWEFQGISKGEERGLLLTDSNALPQHTSAQERESAEILKSLPYLVQGTDPRAKSNEKVCINPAGKSARSLLHEYCLKVMKVKPEYTTKECGVAKTPFLATVEVDGLHYGSGMAASKKQAKHLAAQKTLEIFMPESYEKLVDVEEHLKIFDKIPIEDPNIYDLTCKLGLLSPYQVLNECIKRNQGVLSSELKFELHQGSDRQLHYTMVCGKHKATGTCRNKKYGRELASQSILQKLHPHLKFWGSVLRIYVDEHTAQEFTKPEPPAPVTSTMNKELLYDLKQEMWNLMKSKKKTHTGFVLKSFIDIDL